MQGTTSHWGGAATRAQAEMRLAHDVGFAWAVMDTDGDALAAVARLAAQGRYSALVGRVLPLRDASKAHCLLDEGVVHGKLVLSMA